MNKVFKWVYNFFKAFFIVKTELTKLASDVKEFIVLSKEEKRQKRLLIQFAANNARKAMRNTNKAYASIKSFCKLTQTGQLY